MHPVFDENILRSVCDILGHADRGLSHSQISTFLNQQGIQDTSTSGCNKKDRLYLSLRDRQRRDNCGNNIASFIMFAMSPVNYIQDEQKYDYLITELNKALGFAGLILKRDGKLYRTEPSRTIDDAFTRSSRIRKTLQDRNIHPDVMRFCSAEFLQDNYFHAVFEAAKSIADKIREKSGLQSDGSELVDEAFGKGAKEFPLLAFNQLSNETERSEHTGLMNLLKGLFGTFRNTTAHVPKIKWEINEQDALDMLTLTSLLHRRIDQAYPTKRNQ